ncbi:MAG TPA: alpha/beta fold hydrolase [Blastocatellia bacterium]|nr:alpha/beta fold hydrolase [Blastocatellia bacterium]
MGEQTKDPTVVQADREITFQAEDGWHIYGTLSTPGDVAEGESLPAVLLLHSAGHDQETFHQHYAIPGLSQIFTTRRIASLRIDWRGRGKSIGAKEFHSFTQAERERVYLDVKAAIDFLASQEGIDANRLAVLAEEVSADAAVLGSIGDPRVRLFVFLSGRLGEKAKAYLAGPSAPVLCLVSSDDRPGFRDMAQVYSTSKNSRSEILVYPNLSIGTTMFYLWRRRFPNEKPIDEQIADHVSGYLKGISMSREISFVTEDGWTIYGDLRVPQGAAAKVPGVVLLHTALSDRYVYQNLAEALVSNGMAVLNIDWRGRGKSRGKGKYSELAQEERERGYLDAKGGINFLASQPAIDPSRIAVLGTDRGALHAVNIALHDPRVKALVILTVVFTRQEKSALANLNIPILYIACQGIEDVVRDLTEAHRLSKNRGGRLAIFPGSALGYQLLEANQNVGPMVVNWLKSRLKE